MTGTINANETLNGGVEAIPTLSGTLSGNTTSSYNSLSDKPIINGTTLEGGVDRSLVEDVKVNGVSVVNEEHIAEIEFSAEDVSYDNTDSHAQSTEVQGALDEAFERTVVLANDLTSALNNVAETYTSAQHNYTKGDYVLYETKLYRCIANTSGAWDSTKWEEVKLSNEVSDEVTLREELESATKVYGTPKNLPQPIATFTDGANLPMPNLKVGIEPIQDLHGYDSPWVGGAGKNKFDIDATHTTGTGTYIYEVYVKPNTPYTLSSNCPSSSPANLYFNGGSTETNGVGIGYPKTFNSGEDGKFTIYVRSLASGTAIDLYSAVKNGQYYIQLEEGSTATSYAPYSNICPISGWSAVNVSVTGKNRCPVDSGEVKAGNLVTFSTPLPSGTYSVSFKCTRTGSSSDSASMIIYDKDDNAYSAKVVIPNTGDRLNIENLACNNGISRIYFYSIAGSWGSSQNYTLSISDLQIEIGSTSSTYEPYNGQTYNIQFTDSQGNPIEVYGGECDVVNGTSGNKKTLASVDMGTLNWSMQAGSGNQNARFVAPLSGAITSISLPLCSIYRSVNDPVYDRIQDKVICLAGGNVYVEDNDYTSASAFKTAMNGAQLVYKLATPSTFNSHPTSIKSLEGTNNVWGDCGQIKDLKYVRNLNITINNILSRLDDLEG